MFAELQQLKYFVSKAPSKQSDAEQHFQQFLEERFEYVMVFQMPEMSAQC